MIKKLLNVATLAATLCAAAPVLTPQVVAQDLSKELPNDPKVVTGKLDNGLTYYIRPNQYPKDKVELRLIINAGSILEDDDQLGLAHFTEHMLFNGTKSFPKNELVKTLQNMGVRFGADLNAYTSFDETVYMLPIPTENPKNLEVGFQILREWAQFATMADQDIDDERKIILEEERTGKGAVDRMQKKFLPKYLAGSRYANRLPIGKTELLKTFPYEAIRRFYNDWYRPDLMAVVVVGDISVEQAKKLIQQNFADLKNPSKPRPRTVFDVSPYSQSEAMYITDPEQGNTQMFFSFSAKKSKPVVTYNDYRESLKEKILFGALNKRLQELAKSANPPFALAQIDNSGLIRGFEALSGYLIPSSDLTTGINALVAELLRAHQYGFDADELELTKKEYLASLEKAYNERNTTKSDNLLYEYQAHFLQGEAFPGIELEYELVKKFLPTITPEEIKAKLDELYPANNQSNYFAVVMAPENSGDAIDTDEELKAVFDNAFKQTVTPREKLVVQEKLLDKEPTPGKIVKVTKDNKLGITHYELSNGIKVTVKSTDFKSDEILLQGVKKGGTGNYGANDWFAVHQVADVIESMGYGKYTPSELERALSGKNLSLTPQLTATHNIMNGSSDVKSFETLLQLNYLQLTSPRLDEELLNAYVKKMKNQLKFIGANPQIAFIRAMLKDAYNDNPLTPIAIPTAEQLESLDAKRLIEIYKNEFSNAKGFHYFIVGNVDEETLKPLLEKYIASLPTSGAEPNFKDNGVRMKKGDNTFEFKKGKEPKSLIITQYFGEMPYSEESALKATLIADILTNRVIEKIREEMGAIYGAGFYAQFEKLPYSNYAIIGQLPTGPENVEPILQALDEEINNLIQNGPTSEDLQKVKAAIIETRKESLKTNSYWLGKLQQFFTENYSVDYFLNFDNILNKITTKDIREAAKKFFVGQNRYTAILNPEVQAEEKK